MTVEELDQWYREILEDLNAPCDCDCNPGAHWCFMCRPHGAFTREDQRAYYYAVAKYLRQSAEAHG